MRIVQLITKLSHIRHQSTKSVVLTPLLEYDRLISLGKLKDDPNQRTIIKSLSHLHESLGHYQPSKIRLPNALDQLKWNIWFNRIFCRRLPTKDIPKGIYLYGDVGCGKTMLMDLFYSTIPSHLPKGRIHFHQFIQHVHKRCHDIIKEQNLSELGEAKGREFDPIPFLASEIAEKSRVLCFDEFQVTDVADAMILRRLFDTLLSQEYGLILFATSNRHPDDLYIDGVQRKSFIPCIDLIKQRTEVIFLNSPTDYRKIPRPTSPVYYYPKEGLKYRSKECEIARTKHIEGWYEYFSQFNYSSNIDQKHCNILFNFPLKIWGRELKVPKCTLGRVAQFSFKQLCGEHLAAGDYLTLARSFKSFIVTDIPFLSVYTRDEVRRFITFLDAVYDNGGKLATTSAANFTSLFVEPENILNDYELKKETTESNCQGVDDELFKKHGFSREIAKQSRIFALDEERFAFARALSRLSHMSHTDWVEKK